jgi:hypothetical protein
MNRSLLGTLLVFVLLIFSTHTQAEYLKNGNFQDSSCTITFGQSPADSTTCVRGATTAFGWSTWSVTDPGSGGLSDISIVNTKSIRNGVEAYGILLQNVAQKNKCIKQTITNLPPGDYSF